MRAGRRCVELLIVSLCLLFLTFVFYRNIVFSDRILVSYDLFTYFYPYRAYAAEALKQGHLPLWNPYLFMGAPFLANIQTAVFYPFNLIGLVLEPPQAVSFSIVLHVFLAGLFTYAFARISGGLGPVASATSGVVFMLSGFVSQQAGHINQLNALVWLPLLLLTFDQAHRRKSTALALLGGWILALQLLAGHPQEVYVGLVGLGLFALLRVVQPFIRGRSGSLRRVAGVLSAGIAALWCLAVIGAVGLGLAAIQLLPTLELLQQSIRGGGMSYREAASFSLPPWELVRALLPGYGHHPFSEFIAYVGIIALALALLGFFGRPKHIITCFSALLMALALFLALGGFNPLYAFFYEWVPGLASFRVPARWLYLYTFGMALLAGVGVSCLEGNARAEGWRRRFLRFAILLGGMGGAVGGLSLAVGLLGPLILLPKTEVLRTWALLGLPVLGVLVSSPLWLPAVVRLRASRLVAMAFGLAVAAELTFASRGLDLQRAVLPQAYSSIPSSVAEMLLESGGQRLLSIATSDYVPGDKIEIEYALGDAMGAEALGELVSSTKYKAILAANTPLRYGIATVDGYDGGLLPLKRYEEFLDILLESGARRAGRVMPTGLGVAELPLRFQLVGIPDTDVLSVLNVGYILVDRTKDLWLDHVYYDMGAPAVVDAGSPLTLSRLPAFAATSLGMVSFLSGAANVPQGTPVARIRAWDASGLVAEKELRAGVDSAEGEYGIPWTHYAHGQAKVVGQWPDYSWGHFYHAKLDLGQAARLWRIGVECLLPEGQFHLVAASLIDDRTAVAGGAPTSDALVVDERLELVYCGDLKLYRNLTALPRVFVVHDYVVAQQPEDALRLLEEGFRDRVVLGEMPPLDDATVKAVAYAPASVADHVVITLYESEDIAVEVETSAPGFLVLTDAYYPGWQAQIDGEAVPILRADYLFRAVLLPTGHHRVEFHYRPVSFAWGQRISGVTAALSLAVVTAEVAWRRRRGWQRRPFDNAESAD